MQSVKYTYAEMLLARGFAILGSFGVAILTARMLGPDDRGRYYYIVTLAAVGMQFASFGIQASNTYLVARKPMLLPQILANSVWIAILGGVLAAIGVTLFDYITSDVTQNQVLGLVVLILTPSLLLFLYLSNLVVALNRPHAFNGLVIFGSAASIAMALVAAYPAPSLNRFLVAAVAASVTACVLAWVVITQGTKVPRRFDLFLFYSSMTYAFKAHVATMFGFFMARMSVMIIKQFGSFGDLGHWSIAAQISDALLVLPATIGLLLFPSLVRADVAGRWKEFKFTLVQLGTIMAVLCLAVAAAIQPVIRLVFGADYLPAVPIVLALLPGVFFLGIASVASQFLSANGYPWSQVLAWIFGGIFQAVLSIIFFEEIGVVGLAWVQSACAGAVCLWLFINSLKYAHHDFHTAAKITESPPSASGSGM